MSGKEVNIVKYVKNDGALGFFMFLSYIGALIYFLQQSGGGFWQVIFAFFQAMVWPAYVIFHVLTVLGV